VTEEGRERGSGPAAAFGAYLRTQRQLARLSLRQLAELTRISNPYLSQIERGLHNPSVAVIRALAEALELSAEDLLVHAAGLSDDGGGQHSTEAAIRSDPRLDASQKSALLAVYRSMVGHPSEREHSTGPQHAPDGEEGAS
jgi:transcriptional regulator with XRE-family HTH domain